MQLEDGSMERQSMLTEYAMGKWGEIVPEGVCRTIPAGAMVRWSIHMFPGGVGATAPGTMIKDNVVEIGLWLHPEGYEEEAKYKQDLSLYQISPQEDIVIPPNGYSMTQGFHSFDHPVRIDSFQPHGHLRMNAASLEIFYPETGRTEQISQDLEVERDLAPQPHLQRRCSASSAYWRRIGIKAVVRQHS